MVPLAYTAYAFQDVQGTIVGPGGAISLGFASGAAEGGISIDMTEDKDTMVTGADGTPMHSLHAAQSGLITVRLLKVSPMNLLLSLMYATQKEASVLWGTNTIVITDILRGDVTTGMNCAFRRLPNNVFAKDGNIIEWAFNCGFIDMVLGSGVPIPIAGV